VLRDGPAVGIHSLVWCDSTNNLNRAWDRQTLREFEMRVAFQMSANDSSTLIDTPLASKLGTHRALLHGEEQEVLEKFRPYRPPTEAWLNWVRQQLHGPPEQRDSRSQRLAV
jgi:S-DNA-T family DNA segregation ATPase FtsK/SpoIIIE